jgi:hypothetical protein
MTPSKQDREMARLFHDTYEQLAPFFGYTTRGDTRQFDPESANGKLMTAVCGRVLAAARAEGFAAGIEMAAQCVEDRGHETAGWGFLQEHIRALLRQP